MKVYNDCVVTAVSMLWRLTTVSSVSLQRTELNYQFYKPYEIRPLIIILKWPTFNYYIVKVLQHVQSVNLVWQQKFLYPESTELESSFHDCALTQVSYLNYVYMQHQ